MKEELIKTLAESAGFDIFLDSIYVKNDEGLHRATNEVHQLAELIVQEHIKLLKQEWYDLNSAADVEDESPRDIGLRVGRKSEIISLMAKIKEHFGVEL